MLQQCDFFEQQTSAHEEGRYRPDLIVRLPGGRQVIVDSKVPLEAYLEAIHAQDDATRLQRFKDHARQVRAHTTLLGKKAYRSTFSPPPSSSSYFCRQKPFSAQLSNMTLL